MIIKCFKFIFATSTLLLIGVGAVWADNSGPTVENPVGLFFPQQNLPRPVDLVKCQNQYGVANPQTQNLPMAPECYPDTLYTWNNVSILRAMRNLYDQKSWAFKTEGVYLFLARSPISTNGFGNYPIRLKLKKDVKFHPIDGFETRSACIDFPKEALNTVFIRTNNMYADWVICSPEVIHSWSYGTKEHYDEMIRDYLQHKNESTNPDFYTKDLQQGHFFESYSVDGHDFSEATLLKKFKTILTDTLAQREMLVYNPDLNPAEKNRKSHFSNKFQAYYNNEN